MRFDRAIGCDFEDQFIEFAIVFNPRGLNAIGDFDDRAVVAIGRDDADRVDLALDLVRFARDIATTIGGIDRHLEVAFLIEVGNLEIFVDDADQSGQDEIGRLEDARTLEIHFEPFHIVRLIIDL